MSEVPLYATFQMLHFRYLSNVASGVRRCHSTVRRQHVDFAGVWWRGGAGYSGVRRRLACLLSGFAGVWRV